MLSNVLGRGLVEQPLKIFQGTLAFGSVKYCWPPTVAAWRARMFRSLVSVEQYNLEGLGVVVQRLGFS